MLHKNGWLGDVSGAVVFDRLVNLLSSKTWDAENIKNVAIISGNLVDLKSKAILLANLLKGTVGITSVTSSVHDSVLVHNLWSVVHNIMVHNIMLHNRLSVVVCNDWLSVGCNDWRIIVVRNNRLSIVVRDWGRVCIHICVGVVQTSGAGSIHVSVGVVRTGVGSVHVSVGVVCTGVGSVDISLGVMHQVLSLGGLRSSNSSGKKRNLSEGSHIYSVERIELIYY